MIPDHSSHVRTTTDSVSTVPKQSRPAKASKSVRVRPWLLEQVEALAAEQQLTFNDVVERGLELWLQQQRHD